ncbi:MAG: tetratricopeptide repeat protein [Deltaproteobacteria bacterium]|nr:tetratricopeptide repeat protein [Deltaproteobacteria bacterium]MBW2016194.1 tetratricopeptide repeat protein [Deltaproteobacteria bacterium]MBW2129748.1 tetratricopeptide repeat protein [Deltaproteobacteria bacterium]MBW2302689.1 tetratricopeptide repeat protein [Deltaproteobacteria bacterium]
MIDIHNMTVLIVDDSVPMCQSIHAMMKVMGYGKRFLFANNGKEALAVLQKESVDLVLMDYIMPVMTGAEVLRVIREDRELRDLPVIMISAQAYEDYVAEIGESEIDAFILKPLTIKVLEGKVADVIEKANNPPPVVVHLKRARKYEEKGDLEGAIRETRKAMELNPNSTRPIRELGYFYFKKGEYKEAEKWLLKAAKMNCLDVFAFHYLGELYLKAGDIDKAAQYFEKAMKVSPRQLHRGINFGKVLAAKKLFKKAAEVFDRVLALPGATSEIKEQIADFCAEKGMDEYAAKLLESLTEENSNRWDLPFKLGKVLMKMGHQTKALNFLTHAVQMDKGNIEIRLYLAKLYLSLKKPILAEKIIVEILEIDRDHEEARELLKQC